MKIVKRLIIAALCVAMVVAAGSSAFASDAPSPWAAGQVNAAIAARLVPENLQMNYTQAITRAEFCALAVAVYEAVKWEITGRTSFTDTDDVNVEKAAYAGIVSGVGNNRFDPDSRLTREMAAVMLSNLANAVGRPFPQQQAVFADIEDAAYWSLGSIGEVQAAGIMLGVGGGRFAPRGPYTREQSIVTIMRTVSAVIRGGDTGAGSQLATNVQYVRTNWRGAGGVSLPAVTIITSRAEMNQYVGLHDTSLMGLSSLVDAARGYTDEFFEKSYLVVVMMEEVSGSNRHAVIGVSENGDILIRRLVPEIGTADMALWHIIIELDRSRMPERFNVVFF